jgi:transcriptional antiterminator RfaH
MQLQRKSARRDGGAAACQPKNLNATMRSATSPRTDVVGARANEEFSGALWYVVHTRPHAEDQAIHHLEMQGYRVFCPRYRKTVRHARKAKCVLAPLFPNYLFVRLDISRDRWRSISGTRGVLRLLMRGETPQSVPNGIVDGLQAQMRADGAMDWTPTLKIGGPIRIVDGPFAEFLGTLEHFDAAGRVRVLLDFLGRSVSVALRSEALLPAA